MKALTVTGDRVLELLDIPEPEVTIGKVKVKVAYCGVCGSDLPRYFDGGVHSYPQVLGHEFSGYIEEVYDGVEGLVKGDRVSVAPLIPLTPADTWHGGNPAMAEKYSFIGSREQGAMAEYIVVPADNCVKIPKHLSMKEASMVEPLTVAIHGIDRVNFHSGARVLVLGSGTIGLLTIAVLKARGVGEIVVTDLNDFKLNLAKEMGADVTLNPLTTSIDDYYLSHRRPEIIIETAGSPQTQKQAIDLIDRHGKIVYVGTMTKPITLEANLFEQILRKEAMVTGAWMSYSSPFPGYEWETALNYMANDVVDVKSMITGVYQLEDLEEPFNKMVESDSVAIKLLYEIAGEDNEI